MIVAQPLENRTIELDYPLENVRSLNMVVEAMLSRLPDSRA
jgi:hypothetical protein